MLSNPLMVVHFPVTDVTDPEAVKVAERRVRKAFKPLKDAGMIIAYVPQNGHAQERVAIETLPTAVIPELEDWSNACGNPIK